MPLFAYTRLVDRILKKPTQLKTIDLHQVKSQKNDDKIWVKALHVLRDYCKLKQKNKNNHVAEKQAKDMNINI